MTMTAAKKASAPLDLDALFSREAGRVVIGGVEHVVQKVDGAGYAVLYDLEESGSLDVRPLYALVKRLVPSVPSEAVDAMLPEQVGAIVAVATGKVKAVEEALAPNAAGPATGAPAPAETETKADPQADPKAS